MPVALISKGTTPEQKVVVGTLADISAKVLEHEIQAPTLTIIGEVARTYANNWMETSIETACKTLKLFVCLSIVSLIVRWYCY